MKASGLALWPFGHRRNFPERRQSKRYLTLKNAAFAAAALVVAFVLLSFWSALRPAHSGPSLFEPRLASSESTSVDREPYAVVPEGSVRDYPEAQLIVPEAPIPPSPPVARVKTLDPRESPLGRGQRIMISGGREGVHLHVEAPPAPPSQ